MQREPDAGSAVQGNMMARYDIIRRLADGSKFWVCEAESLQDAKAHLLALERIHPATYYVCDITEKQVLGAATPERPELHLASDDHIFLPD